MLNRRFYTVLEKKNCGHFLYEAETHVSVDRTHISSEIDAYARHVQDLIELLRINESAPSTRASALSDLQSKRTLLCYE